VVVSPRFTAYSEASKAAYAVFDEFSPAVEGLSIDEAFLDVRGLEHFAGQPPVIAARLRQAIREQVGLPITVGVARTKFLAKVASGVAKPDGLLVVPPERELGFLHALPVERVWGVGKVTAEKLHRHGIHTVGELAAESPEVLVAMLERAAGRHLHALAHNRDPRPVETRRRRRSVGAQRAIGRPPHSDAEIDASLVALVDRVTRRMRTAGRAGRTVVLRLRFADYTRATRSHTLPCATAQSAVVLSVARELLAADERLVRERGLTLIGIAVTNLDTTGNLQLLLPLEWRRREALDGAMDDVRARFGSSAVMRAVLVGRNAGWQPPQLPD
jgi:DNA polymerase-4